MTPQKCETPACEAGVTRNVLAGGFRVLIIATDRAPQSLIARHLGLEWLAGRVAQ